MNKIVLVQPLPIKSDGTRLCQVTRMMQDENTQHVIRTYQIEQKMFDKLDHKLIAEGYQSQFTNVGVVYRLAC